MLHPARCTPPLAAPGLALGALGALVIACSAPGPAGRDAAAEIATDARAPGDAPVFPPLDAPPPDDASAADAPSPPADAAMPPPSDAPPAAACPALTVRHDTRVDGYRSDQFVWRDARCRERSAAMVRNDAADPSGNFGGYMRQYTYEVGGAVRTCNGASTMHPGFGYTVNHFGSGSTSASSRRVTGTYRTVFEGRHHALHEYHWRISLGGPSVDATVQWLFATGRDHPVYAITYDATPAGRNVVRADTRSPYGDMLWDGGANAEIAGVGWGDRYRFVSTGSPVTTTTGWDYTARNTVPYVIEWTTTPDAEMGTVQTQTYLQHDAGGYGFYPHWGQRSAGPMPTDFDWTYQLNQYELPSTTRSHRLAWGANFGAVGQAAYPAYGNDRTLVGYPYQSYSVHVVLGTHGEHVVFDQVAQVEAVQATAVTATAGTLVTTGPAGIARSDAVAYDPPGYNPVYGTWEVRAASNRAALDVTVRSGALARPVFVVRGYTATTPPRVTLDGATLAADADYFASLDDAGDAVWITFARSFTGAAHVSIE